MLLFCFENHYAGSVTAHMCTNAEMNIVIAA